MIRIAICDDEAIFAKNIEKHIMKFMENEMLGYAIDIYASGEELIALGLEMVQYDIIFLDINMEGMDGIETARKIREVSDKIFLVFITAFINYAPEGYGVNAIRYILKENDNLQAAIDECMLAIMNRRNYLIEEKEFKFSTGTKTILLDRILYIESSLHKLEFHIMEKEMKIYTMYEKLDKVDDMLQKHDFVRIHQSFLVNVKYIKNVKDYKAILSNGEELIIPKSRYRFVKERFTEQKGEF